MRSKTHPKRPAATPLQLLQIAARALVDPRTVSRRLIGKAGKPAMDAMIDKAIADLGFGHLMHRSR
jgi:hypothetical protein